MGRSLWANFSLLSSGSGTESSPFTYSQIRNYFNPDVGDECEIIPADGDIIYSEGIIDFISSDTVFFIKRILDGNIIIRSKDGNCIPWLIESVDNVNNYIYLIKNEVDYGITGLEIRDIDFFRVSDVTANKI